MKRAYGDMHLRYGPEYIIPKPFDSRALLKVACAVADAAVSSGVARDLSQTWLNIENNWSGFSMKQEVMRKVIDKPRESQSGWFFCRGGHPKIIQAS